MKYILQKILLVIFLLFVFSTAKAASIDDIVKQITALQQQIAQLQAQLPAIQQITAHVKTELEKIPTSVVLQKDLKFGDTNDDVAFAQRILKSQGFFCAKCYVTGYFGIGTKNALQAFQKKYVGTATGIIDSATRSKFNEILQASRASITTNSSQQITNNSNNPISTPTPTVIPTQPTPSVSSGQTTVNSIVINNNDGLITRTPEVTLTLTCSTAEGVQGVRYTNEKTFTQEQFEPFSPTKSWVLSENSGLKTIAYQCKDMKGNIGTTSATITYDVTAPIRLNGLPSGVLPPAINQTAITFTTDESAICKYSTSPGIDYDVMTNVFSATPSISHSATITGLLNGGQYVYYVKCADALSNKNFDDFSIGFRVENATSAMNVVVLKYFPLSGDGKNIDINVTGDVGDSYAVIEQKTVDITNNLQNAIQKSSTYLGYKENVALPSLQYHIIDTKETNAAVPTKNTPALRSPDYFQILANAGICDYVEKQNVNEVWLFAYQGPSKDDGAPYLNISESKMAGPNGDISNSSRYNDMPTCKKTYRVYTFNYGRGTAEALESWSHQMEAELDTVNSTLFRNNFQGVNYPQALSVPGRCGSVHNPPNARYEYDRANSTPQQSDCLNWNPDTLGQTSPISCENWGCQDVSDSNNTSLNYMIWNWQNLPGADNLKTYQSKHLRNWWDIHGDFDNVMANSRRLTIEP